MVVLTLVCAAAVGGWDVRTAGEEVDNPVPAIITVPLHVDFDGNIGSSRNGIRWTIETKPVLPLRLGDTWELAARTIAKLQAQDDVTAENEGQTGLADLSQGLYFGPQKPFDDWFMLAIGATVSLPTATARAFGDQRVSAGPSVLVRLKVTHFTIWLLTGWVGSLGGSGPIAQVSQLSLEGGIGYTTATAWHFGVSTTTTYDGISHAWVAPFTGVLGKVFPLPDGGHITIDGGPRVYLDPNSSTPQYGARFEVVWQVAQP
jgi:hypothetical protein